METQVQVKVKVAKKLTDQQVLFLQNMIDKGGPEPHDYEPFDLLVRSLDEEGVEEMRDVLSPILNNLDTMQGFAYTKPYGYAGDFKIIDMIYENKVSQDPRYRNWDLWWNRSDASKAVRNRKDYFIKLCADLDRNAKGPKEVLILGSGPASDVYEYLSKNPNSKIHFDLIDLDERAVEYSKDKNKKFRDRIDFFRINVLRFKTHKHYDMIWSSGLFDYFKEKHFIYLVKKFLVFLDEQGEMIIGNFSKNNPTQSLMESVCGWYLNYRSEYELYKLAIESGLREDQVMVDKEPLGVNLFLRIKMKKKQFTEYKESISKVADYSVN